MSQSFPFPAPHHHSLSSLKYQRPQEEVNSARQEGVGMGPLKLVKENVVPFGQGKNPKSKTLYFVPFVAGNQNSNKIEKKPTDVVLGPPKPKQKKQQAQENNKAGGAEGGQKGKITDTLSNEVFQFFLKTHSNSSEGEYYSILFDNAIHEDVFVDFLFLSYILDPTLIDQLQTMMEKAHRQQEETRALGTYIYQKGNPIYEVFYWCKVLQANTPTWFRTLELFNRFLLS
jgi:hypothetical protein